jgi:hypothetical protein
MNTINIPKLVGIVDKFDGSECDQSQMWFNKLNDDNLSDFDRLKYLLYTAWYAGRAAVIEEYDIEEIEVEDIDEENEED